MWNDLAVSNSTIFPMKLVVASDGARFTTYTGRGITGIRMATYGLGPSRSETSGMIFVWATETTCDVNTH